MRKKIHILASVGCVLLAACDLKQQTEGVPQAPITEQSSSAQTDVTYVNQKLGFAIILPSGWYLPTPEDPDPHFYENEECSKQIRVTCIAFEIQNWDSDFGKGHDAFVVEAQSSQMDPVKHPSMIPDATVIETRVEAGAEGWLQEYHVFFVLEKRRFLVFTNDREVATSILPTMRLVK